MSDLMITEFRNELRRNGEAICPCCKRFAKVYKRKLSLTTVRQLVIAYRKYGHQWFHIKEIAMKDVVGMGDFGKLKHWGMVVKKENTDPKKKSSGIWAVTTKGAQFVKNQISIPEYVHIYNGASFRFSGEEITIDMVEGFFDYEELMKL